MPEILGVTNPVPGYDSNQTNQRNIPVSPGNTEIANVPDPSRVTRPDGRAEQQDAGTQNQSAPLRYDSNFQTFLQRLRESPDLMFELARIFSGKSGTVVSSGLREGTAAELSEFMEMLKMDEAELVRFLKEQMQTGSRFNGPLFSLLRGAYRHAGSSGLQQDILQFAKHYSDYSSSRHIEGNLLRDLNQMARAIPKTWGSQLIELVAQLENGIKAGDRAGNLSLLQGKILPFMSDYIDNTHDMGRARGLLTLLTLNISRYESGMEANMLQSFQQLKNYAGLRETLGSLDDQALLSLLRNTSFAKGVEQNRFAEQFAQLAHKAMGGSMGVEAQNTFRELLAAVLVNESVYMTVNHMIIPLEWNGQMMFSELWVDPDSDSKGGGEGEADGHNVRFLFKMDIQSLGLFDMVLQLRGETVQLQIQCPERVAPFTTIVEKHITRILAENGLRPELVQVKKMERPLEISQVFPKLFEGKDSINVKV